MKRFLLLACCIFLCASWAHAEIGALCIYADEAGANCSFVDNGGLVQVYIIHQYAEAVGASQFKLDVSAAGWTYLGDVWNYPLVIGTSIDGVSVGYSGCQSSPFVVGTVSFIGSSAPANTGISIVADPSVGEIQAVDCDGYTRVGAGGTAYVNSSIPCVCEANQVPELEVDPPSIDFGYIDETRELTITNRGGGTLTWNLLESEDWFSLSATGGTDRETVTLTVDRTGQVPGVYTGTVEVTSNGGSESVLVMMTVFADEPVLRVSPVTVTFDKFLETAMLYVFNDGASGLQWNVSSDQPWLTTVPQAGVDNTQVSVMVDRTGLLQGTYFGNLFFTSNGGEQTVPVTMIAPSTDPVLDYAPSSFYFAPGEVSKILTVSNTEGGQLQWNITTDQSWLFTNPSDGSNGAGQAADVTVYVNDEALPPGLHNGNLNLTSNGGNATIPVTLEIPVTGVAVSPEELRFFANIDTLYLDIINTGGGDLTWAITSNIWRFSVDPSSGINDQRVMVTVDRTGLTSGCYTFWYLDVTSSEGDIRVPVMVWVEDNEPVLLVSPSELSFGPDSLRTLTVDNAGNGVLEWQISSSAAWLSAAPSSGTDHGVVDVVVDRTGLYDGHYLGNLYVSSNGGVLDIPVDMWVGAYPVLEVSPLLLIYTPEINTHTFSITNAGEGTLGWEVEADQSWIYIVPPRYGQNDATVTVNVDPASVPQGFAVTGHVTVNSISGTASVEIRYVRQTTPTPGVISVFSETYTRDCNFVDNGGTIHVYFYHMNTTGAGSSRWRLDLGGLPWTHVGDYFNSPTVIGNTIDGIFIDYNGCKWSPIYLGSATFVGSSAPACSIIRVVADPAAPSGQIEAVDCMTNVMFPAGAAGVVNPDQNCNCGVIAVQHTTWGAIKALYAPEED